jgi:hypothetical protein
MHPITAGRENQVSKIELVSYTAGLSEAKEFQAIVDGVFDQHDQEYKVRLSACHETGKVDVHYSFQANGNYDKKIHPLHKAVHNALSGTNFKMLANYPVSEAEIEQMKKESSKPLQNESGDAVRIMVLNPAKKL